MGFRLRYNEWQRQLWKFVTHPVTEILALVAVVLVALATLVMVESRLIRSPHTPIIFSPK
jgi:type IV secretory pathway VirB2 component (pilin)